MNVMGYDLVQTCPAFPEAYDVFKDGKEIGYLRLRHGYFAAVVVAGVSGSSSGVEVYDGNPEGTACFEDHEREGFILNAIKAMDEYLKKEAIK